MRYAPSFINLDLMGDETDTTLLQQLRDVTCTHAPDERVSG